MNQSVTVKQTNTRLARGLVWFAGVFSLTMLLMLCAVASNPAALAFVVMFALLVDSAIFAYASSQGYWFEWMIENKWKAVCKGIGGNFVGEGHAKFQPNPLWAVGGSAGKVVRQVKYPKLRDIRGTRDSFTGIVYPLAGQNLDDFNQMADRYALCFRVSWVGFDIDANGLIRIRAGRVPVPVAFEFEE
jgi:hypothetical protein